MKYHGWVSFVLLDNRQNCLSSFYRKSLHEFIKGQGTKARDVHYWLVTQEWLAWCQSPLSRFIYSNFNCSLFPDHGKFATAFGQGVNLWALFLQKILFLYILKHTLSNCGLKHKRLFNHRLGTKKTLSQHDMAVKSLCFIYAQSFASPMYSKSLYQICADPHNACIGLQINLRPIVVISWIFIFAKQLRLTSSNWL